MQHANRWMIGGLIIASLQLSACGTAPSVTASNPQPAEVVAIPGTELSRIMLVPEAVKRLDIQTTEVRDEMVDRKRTVGGQVVTAADSSKLWVRVPLSTGDLSKVDRKKAAMVLPLARTDVTTEVTAKPIEVPAGDNAEEATLALYYEVDSAVASLAPGQRVQVELSLGETGVQRKVVPYGSVIYDLHGETWVYASPEPLSYVRERIVVDYIDGDKAILSDGPKVGTLVVSVGVAELYGTEFGVGH